jgi:hypothetical protein
LKIVKVSREELLELYPEPDMGKPGEKCHGAYLQDDEHVGAAEMHECPFAAEIKGDGTPCNCCDGCTKQCAADV